MRFCRDFWVWSTVRNDIGINNIIQLKGIVLVLVLDSSLDVMHT